jgi:hypothetical protein
VRRQRGLEDGEGFRTHAVESGEVSTRDPGKLVETGVPGPDQSSRGWRTDLGQIREWRRHVQTVRRGSDNRLRLSPRVQVMR